MRTGTTVGYATRRTLDHVSRFTTLYDGLMHDALDEAALAEMEQRDNLFPDLDYRVYAS